MYINGDELKVILLKIHETLNIQTDCDFTDILYEQLKNYENDENVVHFLMIIIIVILSLLWQVKRKLVLCVLN